MVLKNIKNAFTLAEVLITLGIIGVVAALTIPSIVNESKKQETLSQLKKSYANISQAIRLSEADNGPNSTWSWTASGDADAVTAAYNTYFAPYINVSKVCTSCTDCGYPASCSFVSYNSSFSLSPVGSTSRKTLILPDGTILIIKTDDNSIIIDVNGVKPPNVWGLDVFFFLLDGTKGLVAKGYNQVSPPCASTNTGEYCATKIMRDGWMIKDDYPWR